MAEAGFDEVADREAKCSGDVVDTTVVSSAGVSDMVVFCSNNATDTRLVHDLSASDEKGAYCYRDVRYSLWYALFAKPVDLSALLGCRLIFGIGFGSSVGEMELHYFCDVYHSQKCAS